MPLVVGAVEAVEVELHVLRELRIAVEDVFRLGIGGCVEGSFSPEFGVDVVFEFVFHIGIQLGWWVAILR